MARLIVVSNRVAVPSGDGGNLVPLAFNCYVVETGDHTVLIETGGGMGLAAGEPAVGELAAGV